MSGHVDVLASTAIIMVIMVVLVWLISLPVNNTSVADIFWGTGLVVIAWAAWAIGDGNSDRSNLLVAMVSIWGIRLTAHLWRRGRSSDANHHYQSMRHREGAGFAAKSLVTVFLLQGTVLWVVSLPVQLAMTASSSSVGVLAVVGASVWGVGFFFETVGDAQLARFRADPSADDSVLDWGLWRYTRHPNYFGDFCIWWGIWLVAADTSDARFGIVGPLLMSLLLLRLPGLTSLERGLHERRKGYAAYVSRTSAFIPRPPRTP
ncbi:MAG: DUF1295 domain-containing protein [Actinomycetia bacterium]|nr:DUF1295 domain-containing protein [Actinomycetes bacterium]